MEIDLVILWVDGNDPKWQDEFEKNAYSEGNKQSFQYRDWDNLQYIFRAFEQFMPWVRKIHFVTWGHLPKWLNIDHPKLNVVNHEDILDSENLSVFNSNAIEPNIYKIEDLTEKFILFNDDFFITSPLLPERFFKSGLPCDMLVSNALSSSEGVGQYVLNDLEILNRHFRKKTVVKNHFLKWFSLLYGRNVIRNIALLPWPRFTGFIDPHQPQPFLKSTFEEVWDKEKEVLEKTSASKFRQCTDTNQYLFRYWQLASGKFSPISMNDSIYTEITFDNIKSGRIESMITSGKYAMVCLNDSIEMDDMDKFEYAKHEINKYFLKILPNKSDFEL